MNNINGGVVRKLFVSAFYPDFPISIPDPHSIIQKTKLPSVTIAQFTQYTISPLGPVRGPMGMRDLWRLQGHHPSPGFIQSDPIDNLTHFLLRIRKRRDYLFTCRICFFRYPPLARFSYTLGHGLQGLPKISTDCHTKRKMQQINI
jgi:hypothetical protein